MFRNDWLQPLGNFQANTKKARCERANYKKQIEVNYATRTNRCNRVLFQHDARTQHAKIKTSNAKTHCTTARHDNRFALSDDSKNQKR